MLYLRRFLAQKISSHSGGDGAFLLRKLLTKPSGRDVLTREECTKAGSQQDEFASAPKHDMDKLKEWVDDFYASPDRT